MPSLGLRGLISRSRSLLRLYFLRRNKLAPLRQFIASKIRKSNSSDWPRQRAAIALQTASVDQDEGVYADVIASTGDTFVKFVMCSGLLERGRAGTQQVIFRRKTYGQ